MQDRYQSMVDSYVKNSIYRSVWMKFVQFMVCVVVFCTTYALILPAITVEQTYYCGLEAHEHTDECYDQETLICPLEEHVHQDTCQPDPEADVENDADWEAMLAPVERTESWPGDLASIAGTQIGYRESQRNYLVEEDGTHSGYTRYGAWYGIPYGDWNAMFASFCLHYAGVPQEALPRESDPQRWMEQLQTLELLWAPEAYTIRSGDLIFFTYGEEEAVRVGIVADASQDKPLRIIAGDVDGTVAEMYPEADTLLGICDLAAIQEATLATLAETEGTEATESTQPTVGLLASDATVNVNITGWSNTIQFDGGNQITCPVGSTIILRVGASQCNYVQPNITVTGGELVSVTAPCDDSGHSSHTSQQWCTCNLVHTITVKVTSQTVTVSGTVDGGSWSVKSVEVIQPESGGTTDPTEAPEETTTPTEAPEETTTPTEAPEETTAPTEAPEETTAPTEPKIPDYPYYPEAVGTGTVEISRLRFYNFCENGEGNVTALAGCVFEIRDSGGNLVCSITSGTDPEVNLPDNIPDGTYTITEVSTPSGYMRDTNYQRQFTVSNGALVSDKTIGTFINHDLNQITSGKTAEVEDYAARIYQVMLSAEAHLRMYEMGPVDVLFVVDQSNSMLFPSGLKPTGKQVTLDFDGDNNVNNIEAQNLDKNQLYYIIADPEGTSTVYALWYNGRDWIYQDASYYAKAWYENGEGYESGSELAIFPYGGYSYKDQVTEEDKINTNYRSNGGDLGLSMDGCTLGKYISAQGGTHTFTIYTATDEYNRLHYLEESLANMIYTLADANSENRVTLTEFTRVIDSADDLGPLELTPTNTELLVDKVRHINTSGGTRQDIALKHVYENHLNDSSESFDGGTAYTYTILITDGAPVYNKVEGSNITSLGSPDDAGDTNGTTVYSQIKGWAEQVRSKSTLMTVGLGMDNVEGGKRVLQEIASSDKFSCALEDAAELVHNMQNILFDSFKPQEDIDVTGDVVDEISDSFYPIAWTAAGAGAATGRPVLVQNTDKDWIQLQPGDWITLEGAYTTAGAADAAGELFRREDGTFYIQWKNIHLSNPNPVEGEDYDPVRTAWVSSDAVPSDRKVIAVDGDKTWIELNVGDWISQYGEYYNGTPGWSSRRYYGQLAQSGSSYYISWGRSANSGNNRQMYSPPSYDPWSGTFYLKAKEDFIGGNAIDTNKSAYIHATGHADLMPSGTKFLPTPTVNVHLLDMNEHSSQVTVYLGDLINAPESAPENSLRIFYNQTLVEKILSGSGDVRNKVESADGLEDAVFTLRYAMGRNLTEEEWQRLIAGETITIPYTYDEPSSHGPVGYFSFRLEKTGNTADYGVHPATAACQHQGNPLTENCADPVETYTLHISYTAYALDENGRPEANVNNGEGGPGTEVGTGDTLDTGLGTVAKENVHEVHVICGSIEIFKRMEDGIILEEEQTFSFVLQRVKAEGDTSEDLVRTVTITIPAGGTTGSVLVTHLPRGTYTVTEAENANYSLKEIQVLSSTNCHSNPAIGASATEVTFTLGNNIGNANVIGKASQNDTYTSYIDPGYGVYGAAEFTNQEKIYRGNIPVEKVWSDGPDSHGSEAVYLVLYRDGAPVLDENLQARLLRLDAANSWKGSFEVPLADQNDTVANYNYSVREVSAISDTSLHNWHPAILENDGTTLLYYQTALEEGDILGMTNRGYVVQYAPGENGAWIVTNARAVELPMTGGMGTGMYTFSGLLVMLAALVYYGYSQRRKQERGAVR